MEAAAPSAGEAGTVDEASVVVKLRNAPQPNHTFGKLAVCHSLNLIAGCVPLALPMQPQLEMKLASHWQSQWHPAVRVVLRIIGVPRLSEPWVFPSIFPKLHGSQSRGTPSL